MDLIRAVTRGDRRAWVELRRRLWPDGQEADHQEEIVAFFAGAADEPKAVLVAEDCVGVVVGFVELSIRSYAEGCHSGRVAYLEGWFVAPEARRRGIGRALVDAAQEWGRSLECTEFASDAEVDNEVSAAAHRALGFSEVGVVRCFRKDLR